MYLMCGMPSGKTVYYSEKYDGTVTIRTEDGGFLLSILFPA